MVAIASRARALSAVAAVLGVTLIAALALRPGQGASTVICPLGEGESADPGLRLTASWQPHPAGDDVVFQIAAPSAAPPARPPLSVALVIDRSKSMSGEPLEHAKAAAARLVSQLDAGDAFAVIAYSDGDTTVVPMLRASAVNKQLALRAIGELAVDNGTCISCGIERAGEWLGRTPIAGGVRRMVLLSDGYANLGLRDPDDLVHLAAETATRGISITAVGVGLDFDEPTMMRIAEIGRGRYYRVEDTGGLGAVFDREVAGLAATVATDVRLVVQVAEGVHVDEIHLEAVRGQASVVGSDIAIPIADLAAGETRRVLLRISGAPAPRSCGLAATLTWRRTLDGAGGRARAIAWPGR